jgi:hypothetical protein
MTTSLTAARPSRPGHMAPPLPPLHDQSNDSTATR